MTRNLARLATLGGVTMMLALAPVAAAKPPKVGAAGPVACNLKALPLTVGNTWSYKSGAQTLVIKVLEVGPGKDFSGKPATVATLEENLNGRAIKTTFTCTPTGGMFVPLESFFFDGEPGGGTGLAFTVTDRDKPTWLVDDMIITEQGWVEIVKADVARPDTGGAGATHPPAKVEVERHIIVKAPEKIMIGLGEFQAQKIQVELRGRGIVGEEKTEIPIKRPGAVWLVKGIGYVKVEDVFDKTWELVDTNLVAK